MIYDTPTETGLLLTCDQTEVVSVRDRASTADFCRGLLWRGRPHDSCHGRPGEGAAWPTDSLGVPPRWPSRDDDPRRSTGRMRTRLKRVRAAALGSRVSVRVEDPGHRKPVFGSRRCDPACRPRPRTATRWRLCRLPGPAHPHAHPGHAQLRRADSHPRRRWRSAAQFAESGSAGLQWSPGCG